MGPGTPPLPKVQLYHARLQHIVSYHHPLYHATLYPRRRLQQLMEKHRPGTPADVRAALSDTSTQSATCVAPSLLASHPCLTLICVSPPSLQNSWKTVERHIVAPCRDLMKQTCQPKPKQQDGTRTDCDDHCFRPQTGPYNSHLVPPQKTSLNL